MANLTPELAAKIKEMTQSGRGGATDLANFDVEAKLKVVFILSQFARSRICP